MSGARRTSGLTQRRMLEGKRDNVLDPLDGVGGRIPGETLADENLDAPEVVTGAPVVLEE